MLATSLCRTVVFSWLAFALFSLAAQGQVEAEPALADYTRELLADLAKQKDAPPVKIEVFVSPRAPAKYVSTIKMLRQVLAEMDRLGGERIQVTVNEAEAYSPEAVIAYTRHDIHPYPVQGAIPGIIPGVYVFCGVIVSSGDQTVRAAYLAPGDTLEYRLVQAIQDVTKHRAVKKRIGILKTQAHLFGGFTPLTARITPKFLVIEELEKHYDVVAVDPSGPLDKTKITMLMIPQISSLDPEAFDNTLKWIREGIPALIFEDPLPMVTQVAGTADLPVAGFPATGQRPRPKPNLDRLWDLLGVKFAADRVVWQDHVPAGIRVRVEREMLFITRDTPSRAETIAKDHEVTARLNSLLFFSAGAIVPNSRDMKFIPLATSSDSSGLRRVEDIRNVQGNVQPRYVKSPEAYVVAAEIKGSLPDAKDEMRAILVADLDCLSDVIVQLRDQPSGEAPIPFDNLDFLMNCIDSLIGDDRFMVLRSRRPVMLPSTELERQLADAIRRVEDNAERAGQSVRQRIEDDLRKYQEQADQQLKENPADREKVLARLRVAQELAKKELAAKQAEIEKQRARALAEVRRQLQDRLELLPTK